MSRNIGRIYLRALIASSTALAAPAAAEEAGPPLRPTTPPAAPQSAQPSQSTTNPTASTSAGSASGEAPSAHGLGAAPRPAVPLQPSPPPPDPVKLGGFRPKPDPAPNLFFQEGSYVFERPARFQTDADGRAVLRFDPKPGEPKPPVVYVLPNLKRMAVEDALKGRSLPLIVSGTVTDYEGHNYLLMDDGTRPAGPPTTAPAQAQATQPAQEGPPAAAATTPAAGPATVPTTAGAAPRNLSSEQLLGQLLKSAPPLTSPASAGSSGAGTSSPATPAPLRWDKPIETDRTGGRGAVKPGAPAVTLIREGHYLTDRMGRISRGAGAASGRGLAGNDKPTEFVLDADGKALRDPPLIVMPGNKLLIMQVTAAAIGKDVRFRVSGTVTEYRGRNYILPEKIVLVPDIVQSF